MEYKEYDRMKKGKLETAKFILSPESKEEVIEIMEGLDYRLVGILNVPVNAYGNFFKLPMALEFCKGEMEFIEERIDGKEYTFEGHIVTAMNCSKEVKDAFELRGWKVKDRMLITFFTKEA